MLRVHTTCPTCQQELPAPSRRNSTHPGCAPSTDPGAVLARQFLAAAAGEAGVDTEADTAALAAQLDAYHHRAPDHLAAALTYARWGWAVFPVRPGQKTPLTKHGLHDASTDTATLGAWWQRWPQANVGLPTGGRFDVIDVDPAGLGWLADISDDDDTAVDVHGLVSTPRGGQHLYVTPTGSRNAVNLAPGVDYRGSGGYVVAPPSRLDAHALHGPVPTWPLRYDWLALPSPVICGAPWD